MTLACEPGPASLVSRCTLPFARAEPERDPVERSVALDLRALRAEHPRLLGQVLAADVAQVRVRADDDLGDRVEQRVERRVGREPLLPDLGLGALLEDDQRAPRHRGLRRGLDGGDQHRRLERRAARHVDERAAGPVGRVARGEVALVGRPRCRGGPRPGPGSARPPRRAAARSAASASIAAVDRSTARCRRPARGACAPSTPWNRTPASPSAVGASPAPFAAAYLSTSSLERSVNSQPGRPLNVGSSGRAAVGLAN